MASDISNSENHGATHSLSDSHMMGHYALVGAIASHWAVLELAIDIVICRLAGIQAEAGLCLTYQIQSVRNKLLAVESLLYLRNAPPEFIKDLRRFMNGLESTTKARNRAMHDALMSDSDRSTMQFARKYVDRKLVLSEETTSLKQLNDTANDIARQTTTFNALMNKATSLWPPLPEKFPPQLDATHPDHIQVGQKT